MQDMSLFFFNGYSSNTHTNQGGGAFQQTRYHPYHWVASCSNPRLTFTCCMQITLNLCYFYKAVSAKYQMYTTGREKGTERDNSFKMKLNNKVMIFDNFLHSKERNFFWGKNQKMHKKYLKITSPGI